MLVSEITVWILIFYHGLLCVFQDHVKFVHLQEVRYNCEECSKSFVHATDLGQHIRKYHSNVKNHKCTICLKVRVNYTTQL